MTLLKNEKGFTAFEIIIVLVALVVIGAAGYYAYQARQNKSDYSVVVPKKSTKTPAPVAKTTDPTAGWYTYSDSKYGYSIKMPSSWQRKATASVDGLIFGQNLADSSPFEFNGNHVVVAASKSAFGAGNVPGNGMPTGQASVNIGGVTANEYTFEGTQDAEGKTIPSTKLEHYSFSRNGTSYLLDLSGNPADTATWDTYKTIRDSFKFN